MKYPVTDEYDASGRPPALTPGDYKVKLKEVLYKDKEGNILRYKTTKYEYFKLVFDVSGHPNRLYEMFSFDPNNPHASISLGRFKQFLVATGNKTDVDGDIDDLIGEVCGATIKVRDDKGTVYNDVVQFKQMDGIPDDLPPEEPPPDTNVSF